MIVARSSPAQPPLEAQPSQPSPARLARPASQATQRQMFQPGPGHGSYQPSAARLARPASQSPPLGSSPASALGLRSPGQLPAKPRPGAQPSQTSQTSQPCSPAQAAPWTKPGPSYGSC